MRRFGLANCVTALRMMGAIALVFTAPMSEEF